MPDQDVNDVAALPAPPEDAAVSLVQLDDEGRFAVVARSIEDAREVVAQLGGWDESGALPAEASAIGIAGAAVSGLGAAAEVAASFQGVVRLAPDTLQLLAAGNHLMQSGGYALGTVVNANGQIVANAAFVSVSSATQIASLAASLGTSVALIAIQLQLSRIEKAIGTVTDLVRELADEQREHRWADLETRIDRIVREASWAVELGQVPSGMADELRGDAHVLEAYCRAASRTLGHRVGDLVNSAKAEDQRTDIQSHAYRVARDLVDMVAAADCLYAYEVIRATALTQQGSDGPVRRYAERIVEDAATRADSLRLAAARETAQLQRRLHQIEARPGSAVRPKKKAEAQEIAARFAETIASIAPEPPPTGIDASVGFDEGSVEALSQELRWLPLIPQVECLFAVDAPRWSTGAQMLRSITSRDAFVAIGNGRVVVGLMKDFIADGRPLVDAAVQACACSGTSEDGSFKFSSPGATVWLRPHQEQAAISPSWLRHRIDVAMRESADRLSARRMLAPAPARSNG